MIELIQHNEKTLTSRSNFFLVAESIFILAHTTLINKEEDFSFIIFILAILGFCISFLWFYWGFCFYGNTKILIEEIKENNDIKNTNIYFQWRKKCQSGANFIFSKILPSFFIIFWLTLIIYFIKKYNLLSY